MRVCTCAVLICPSPTAPFAIRDDVIPPVATATVPLPVMGPPVRPAPVATAVTVPPLSLSTLSAKPAGLPVTPAQGAASAAALLALHSVCGAGFTSCREPTTV